ncbi:MAG: saccharopine dehydrogenase NADP-binding domain-containing protein [Deltaproteobacteria bacterium]|nr:saccharopine dehydrogenase NADP-binding domain-containing protein [Deltaproteobacteria bacterium]
MRVAILGAAGELGGRAAALLRRWLPEAELRCASRRGHWRRGAPGAVRALPLQRVERADQAALAGWLRGATLLVNAAGPYDWDPAPLVRACVRARCHYADLAESEAFAARVRLAAREANAARAGIALLPGCSTAPGLLELLAQRWRERPDIAAVDAFLSMGSRNPPSRGLLAGLLAPLGRPMQGGSGDGAERCFAKLVAARARGGVRLLCGNYPAALPEGALHFGARRVPLGFHIGFDRAWIARALHGIAPLLGALPPRNIARLAKWLLPMAQLARRLGTPRGILLLIARDAAGAERDRLEIRALQAGLDIPAAPPLWVAQQLAREAPRAAGALRLADLVPAQAALTWLAAAGYEI